MIDKLADLPLSYQPGTAWEYSVATDVLGRVVEVASGKPLDAFIKARIFDPLGMVDTGFFAPEAKKDRLVAYYRGADVMDPMKPGLWRHDNQPYPGAFAQAFPRLSGGGGLVSTLPDMLALVRAMLPGSGTLLKPDTLRQMMTNQLGEGQTIRFANLGAIPGKGFGLGGAVTFAPTPFDPPNSTGEFQWGGVAGTHWWICPQANTAGVLMAQRAMGFWNPSSSSSSATLMRRSGADPAELFLSPRILFGSQALLPVEAPCLGFVSEGFMAIYRKNIGGLHQAVRVVLGAAVAIAAFVYLSGPAAWAVALSGAGFALTGLVGYCPMCAMAGVGRGDVS